MISSYQSQPFQQRAIPLASRAHVYNLISHGHLPRPIVIARNFMHALKKSCFRMILILQFFSLDFK